MKMLGNIIREVRKDRNMIISYVAHKMGIDPSLLGRIERCQKHPTRRHILELSEILNTDQEELLANYLSEGIVNKIKDEPLALRAISLAHQKITYLSSLNQSQQKPKPSHQRPTEKTLKLAFMRTRIQKQLSIGSPRVLYTAELTTKLDQLRATSEEFTKATVTKSEEQFLAESIVIIDLIEEIRNQVKPEPFDVS